MEWNVCQTTFPSGTMSVCLSVCLCIYPSVFLSIYHLHPEVKLTFSHHWKKKSSVLAFDSSICGSFYIYTPLDEIQHIDLFTSDLRFVYMYADSLYHPQ